MASAHSFMAPEEWAATVVVVVLGVLAVAGLLSAVVRRGGRRG